ncbi:ABC transporter substrate-binding protein [Cohnella nanjingensis]|uniref:Extracellular solute-binding protein n=1 Tax=Cohnella nanjingensis TaxID=1387779 RepID=A0A7X0VEI3_9BACL|nr:extracellular solute-binding protein [Cohnella nanjingensis]MBB6670751.1 extracellular solute-binding protein [Cohnella nanjingensis]
MRKMRFFMPTLALAMIFSFTACSGGNKDGDANPSPSASPTATQPAPSASPDDKIVINEGKPVRLLVDLNNLTPSISDKPTAENPQVFTSTNLIAQAFMEKYPNVKIEWVRNIPPVNSAEQLVQYMTSAIASDSAPDIMFAFGSTMADKNWFMNMDDALKTPNSYVEGNEKWSDLFPSYVFDPLKDFNGHAVAIPLTVFPGPPTAYYYNKDIFAKVGVDIPKDWEELMDVSKKIKAAGYDAIGPWSGNKTSIVDNWDVQFSVGPAFSMKIKDRVDYNKDGKIDLPEQIRAAYEGVYFASNENVQQFWGQIKKKYTEVLNEGYAKIDYQDEWVKGKLAMIEDGLWRLPQELSDTQRKFEFGMFPPPAVTDKTSPFAAKIEYTEKGPYQPAAQHTFNIIEPSIKAHGGEGVRQAAVEFLKFLTAPENVSMMVLEKKGSALGAVKGTQVPPELNDWFKNSFPIIDGTSWLSAPTTNGRADLNRQLDMWFKGMIDDKTFYGNFDAALKKDISSYIKDNKVNTEGWQKGY